LQQVGRFVIDAECELKFKSKYWNGYEYENISKIGFYSLCGILRL